MVLSLSSILDMTCCRARLACRYAVTRRLSVQLVQGLDWALPLFAVPQRNAAGCPHPLAGPVLDQVRSVPAVWPVLGSSLFRLLKILSTQTRTRFGPKVLSLRLLILVSRLVSVLLRLLFFLLLLFREGSRSPLQDRRTPTVESCMSSRIAGVNPIAHCHRAAIGQFVVRRPMWRVF
ncbi:MAG: hypothetical protein KatS3mg105_4950 [Gemmatales bacterium]|nr:MAG: hypothetical protein KatS3mg105_4950 [Gemmatales bacterium]